ncbi:hypothetical protein [Streptomyces shenzhenensis]|uniref:hypothetical protein n=1 Tax=Streptomyces shenzhenensis TaxID=943815 RepID=UPI0015F0E7FC|nr:hypothetical protein [Streptomyces shenzhenensis]
MKKKTKAEDPAPGEQPAKVPKTKKDDSPSEAARRVPSTGTAEDVSSQDLDDEVVSPEKIVPREALFLPREASQELQEFVSRQVRVLVDLLEEGRPDESDAVRKRRSAYEEFPRDERLLRRGRLSGPSALIQDLTNAVIDEFKADLGFRTRHTSKGSWLPTVTVSGGAPKITRRDLQLLSQLSQMLINHLREQEVETTEIEAMAVNGRILVSANEPEVVDALTRLNLATVLTDAGGYQGDGDPMKAKARKLSEVAQALASGSGAPGLDSERVQAGARRLVQLGTDCLMESGQEQSVKAILNTLFQVMTVQGARTMVVSKSPKDFEDLVCSEKYAGRVIAIPARRGDSHAEQNLVHAAVVAGIRLNPIAVAGGKRPCTMCWLTLCLARANGYDVYFNGHPGGLWTTTTQAGLHLVAKQLGITGGDLLKQLRSIARATGREEDPGLAQYITALSGATAGPGDSVGRDAVYRSATYSTKEGSFSFSDDFGDDQSQFPYGADSSQNDQASQGTPPDGTTLDDDPDEPFTPDSDDDPGVPIIEDPPLGVPQIPVGPRRAGSGLAPGPDALLDDVDAPEPLEDDGNP